MNTKTLNKNFIVLFALFAAVLMTVIAFDLRKAHADEIAPAVVAGDADNDGIADSVEVEIAAQQKASEEAKLQAEAQVAAQQKAAEEARIKAEKEIEEQKRAVEAEQKRIEAENKAREEEIARKKAEEEARKQAEEEQRKFEESLSATGMSDEDFNALCKIVQAEDGHDTIEGRIGIANVILNRVRSPLYPNTIMGVITAPGQFGPVSSGKFAAAIPSASTISAVKKAVAGANTVGNALYFHRGTSFGNRTFITMAGAHGFFA